MSNAKRNGVDVKRVKHHAREIVAKLPAVAAVMARYKDEMQEGNRLVQTDIRAGVEQMMLAAGNLNDALGCRPAGGRGWSAAAWPVCNGRRPFPARCRCGEGAFGRCGFKAWGRDKPRLVAGEAGGNVVAFGR
jgi:hypothetical protein